MTSTKKVFAHVSAYHDIRVTDRGFLRTLSFGKDRQSSMFLDSPFETDFEYPSYFHVALALKPDAATALAIGLGGGTVVKRMWHDYAEMRIDAVELDPAVVDVARHFFELPDDERIRIFTGEGRDFLETRSDTYDIIMVDAFDKQVVPSQLTSDGFMRVVSDRLSGDGVAAYNFIGQLTGRPFRELHGRMARVWNHVWVFVANEGVSSGNKNLIVFGTDAPVTESELRDRIADRVAGRVSVPAFHLFGDDLWVATPE